MSEKQFTRADFVAMRDKMAERLAKAGPIIRGPLVPYWQESQIMLAALDLAAASASGGGDHWFPIASAPKDGTFILVDCFGGSIGKWETSKPGDKLQLVPGAWAICVLGESSWGYGEPNFWRHLRPPPTVSSRYSEEGGR